jgi:prepilin-type N-terminal cleavage/methylation domain-containing protein
MTQNHKKGNKGFSFVEAMVVAVIVGILAAVAIPMYNGFIKDQRISTVNNLAETAAAAANAYVRRTCNCTPLTSNASLLGIYSPGYNVAVSCGGINNVTVRDLRYPSSIYATRNF